MCAHLRTAQGYLARPSAERSNNPDVGATSTWLRVSNLGSKGDSSPEETSKSDSASVDPRSRKEGASMIARSSDDDVRLCDDFWVCVGTFTSISISSSDVRCRKQTGANPVNFAHETRDTTLVQATGLRPTPCPDRSTGQLQQFDRR